MSALTDWSNLFPLSILLASLLGSGHCIAMCGGIVLVVAQTAANSFRYHLGRMIGYTTLGACAGTIGERLFKLQALQFLPWFAASLLSLSLIFMGIQAWRGESPHLFKIPPTLLAKVRKNFGHGPLAMGFFTSLLPCGWLHTFVIAAVATQSAPKGALYMLFFWLGTVPALQVSPWAITKILRPITSKAPKLSAICLILIGLGSIGIKLIPVKSATECPLHPTAHCEQKSN